MLSEAQEKWIKNKENQLTQLIQNNWPLSDDDWTFVANFLTKTLNFMIKRIKKKSVKKNKGSVGAFIFFVLK